VSVVVGSDVGVVPAGVGVGVVGCGVIGSRRSGAGEFDDGGG